MSMKNVGHRMLSYGCISSIPAFVSVRKWLRLPLLLSQRARLLRGGKRIQSAPLQRDDALHLNVIIVYRNGLLRRPGKDGSIYVQRRTTRCEYTRSYRGGGLSGSLCIVSTSLPFPTWKKTDKVLGTSGKALRFRLVGNLSCYTFGTSNFAYSSLRRCLEGMTYPADPVKIVENLACRRPELFPAFVSTPRRMREKTPLVLGEVGSQVILLYNQTCKYTKTLEVT